MSAHPNAPDSTVAVPTVADRIAQAPRVLPHNLEAEASVLGGLLLDARRFVEVQQLLEARHFYSPPNEAIWQAMGALDAKGIAIDQLAVAEEMRIAGTFDRLRAHGGEAYFADLTSAVVTTENIEHHAKMVVGKARVRQVMLACQEAVARGFGDYGDVEEYLDGVERAVMGITAARSPSRSTQAGAIADRVVTEAVARADRNQEINGIATLLTETDKILRGWKPKKLYILAARPSVGKSALAMQCAEAAGANGDAALVFSLEMDEESLIERALAGGARIDGNTLRRAQMSSQQWLELNRARAAMHDVNLEINEEAESLPQIRSAARVWAARVHRQWESKKRSAEEAGQPAPPRPRLFIVVDYLQLMDTQQQRGESREAAIGRMSTGLKRLAKQLDCTVLALAQLSRKCEDEKRRPKLSDLRDSGQIEQDADAVIFLYSEDEFHKLVRLMEIIIAKQRGGDVGTAEAIFERAITRFSDVAGVLPFGEIAPVREEKPEPKKRTDRRGRAHHSEQGDSDD